MFTVLFPCKSHIKIGNGCLSCSAQNRNENLALQEKNKQLAQHTTSSEFRHSSQTYWTKQCGDGVPQMAGVPNYRSKTKRSNYLSGSFESIWTFCSLISYNTPSISRNIGFEFIRVAISESSIWVDIFDRYPKKPAAIYGSLSTH